MRILILGGAGMLGHRLYAALRRHHDVAVTLRLGAGLKSIFDPTQVFEGVDVLATDRMLEVVSGFRPDAIINAVGLIKQRVDANESIPNIELNALVPHRLSLIAKTTGARLIHFSTDCVFSGRKGKYTENDVPDAEDLYGRTKLLGEVHAHHTVTLRSSLIGHELERKTSLVEWFLAQRGSVRGFKKAIFSGFTTIEMARIVRRLLERYPEAHGVWHVSSQPIDKYELLNLVKKYYAVDTEIEPDESFICDRSLDSSRFRAQFEYVPPSWDSMIAEMSKQRLEERSQI